MMNENKTYDVEVIHDINAPPEQVYDAWLDPHLAQKWFGPDLGDTQPVQIDAKVGGQFRIVQIRSGQPVEHSGQYLALERPEHLAFTWVMDDEEGHDVVNVYIASSAEGAAVRLVHTTDAKWREYADQIHQAWASMLGEMDAILTS